MRAASQSAAATTALTLSDSTRAPHSRHSAMTRTTTCLRPILSPSSRWAYAARLVCLPRR